MENKYLLNILWRILLFLSPTIATKLIYKKRFGKHLNLKKPRDFNEKLQWLKLNWRHPLILQCTDRIELRKFVISKNLEHILIPIYGSFDSASDINWEALPKKFALKTTNSCGTNIICHDKSSINKKSTLDQVSKWMKQNYSLKHAEIHYSHIKARIICEQLIGPDNSSPNDYKIYCFNGVAKLVLVCANRKNNLERFFLDLSWKKINIGSQAFNNGQPPEKPISFKKMIIYSESLASNFPFVRVDFYEHKGKPILGEMTFTPMACMADKNYYNENGLLSLGDMLLLPETPIKKFPKKNFIER